MKVQITVVLTIRADRVGDATYAVERVLDAGTFQDAIADFAKGQGCTAKVTNAEALVVPHKTRKS